jgi:hypothetical protein
MTFSKFSLSGLQKLAPLALLGTVLLVGCKDDKDQTPTPGTMFGKPVAIGGGSARAYITTNATGTPIEVGVRVTEGALTALPTAAGTMYMYELELPATAGQTPFDHVSFNWNPYGHDPIAVYGAPHFDVHFYLQPQSEQHAITQDDLKGDIKPASAMLPADYQPTPDGSPNRTVAMEGRHWIDVTSPELVPGNAFSNTFIYGSYNGHVTFLEPMLVKTLLTPTVNISAAIKQPQAYEVTGKYYPNKYTITYDAATKEYIVAMGDMVKR